MTVPTWRSDRRPDFTPFTIRPPEIRGFAYDRSLADELGAGSLTPAAALAQHRVLP